MLKSLNHNVNTHSVCYNSATHKKRAAKYAALFLYDKLCRSLLALRELEAPTGFALAEFFAFHDPAVARQEAGGFQGAA